MDVSPVLISYQHRHNGVVPVHQSNVTTRVVTLTPHALPCEVQPVSVENITSFKDDSESTEVDIMGLVNFSKDELSSGKLQKLTELLHNYNIFF